MAYHRVASRRAHNHAVESLRRSLPINVYLKLMHQGATMGYLPQLDESGNATGNFTELKADQRLASLNFLINKAMPDLKSSEAPPIVENEDLLDHDALAGMTTSDLIGQVQASAARVAEDDPVNTPVPAPTPTPHAEDA